MKRNSQARRRRSDYVTEQQRRIGAAKLFRNGCSQAEVSRTLLVSRQTASRWYAAWKSGGRAALVGAGRTGRKSRLSGEELCRLEAVLLAGALAQGYETELWTLKRIAQVIRREFGVTYHASHVWKVLGQLGWSCQRPERKARERNEESIRRWVRYRWPRIRRGRGDTHSNRSDEHRGWAKWQFWI
jgi:transposase